jgi:hypothetical protein
MQKAVQLQASRCLLRASADNSLGGHTKVRRGDHDSVRNRHLPVFDKSVRCGVFRLVAAPFVADSAGCRAIARCRSNQLAE